MNLRDYQEDIFKQVITSATDDIVQLETGAGKTPIEAALAESAEFSLLVAHRNILITQMSEKLAAFGLDHDTISTEHTRRRCMLTHRQHGRNHIRRGHPTRRVASIDSLLAHHRRDRLEIDRLKPWLIVIDEAHHVVTDNKWGRLRELFPNARIVGFTATPARMDGESLHVSTGGLFEELIQAKELKGDGVKVLIERGYLSDFRIYAPPVQLGYQEIAGDPIEWYKRLASGKRAVMMCPSIKNAEEYAGLFIEAGVPAAAISSNMTASDVARVLDAFYASRVLVLCNVDMVGEGFDVPGIEVMIMARKTMSFVAYRQWIGRALRPADGKEYAIIIDHAGNVLEHGMPDDPVKWDLVKPPVGPSFLRSAPCSDCSVVYAIKLRHCPDCGAENELHTRGVIGGHYVNIKTLDMGLVERAKREFSDQQIRQRRANEVVWPSYHVSNNAVSQACNKIRRWFVEQLEAVGIGYEEINDFLSSGAAHSQEFWIDHFTLADTRSDNLKKAQRAFRKWQRSEQSMATRSA